MPGGRRSPKGFENDPGPGQYNFDNKGIGSDPAKISIHTKVRNIHGKFFKEFLFVL